MADKVGDEFDGYITGVAAFGLFIELVEHFVEGPGAHLDDGRRLLPVRRARPHPARREHRPGLPARRSGERAGGESGHGTAPGRSGPRGDPRSRSRIRAPPRPAPEPRGSRTAHGGGRTADGAGAAHVEDRHTAQAAAGAAGTHRTEGAPLSAGRSIVVGTAGHIDHGKSALVRALTGIDPDRLKEEKARGITIDLGFAHTEADGVNLAFVDVPGHERFVKNMLAGAGGIDLVLLVVAADESVMPQTREHFQICRLLQVPAGLVVLTKADLADDDLLEIARMDVAELVADSFLQGAPVVAASSRTGAGLDQVRHTLAALARGIPERRSGGAVRLPIDRVFSVRGFGTVVTGTLVGGRDSRGGRTGRRAPRTAPQGPRPAGARRGRARGGGRTTARGQHRRRGGRRPVARRYAEHARGALEPTQRLDAILDLLEDSRPLKHGARVRFHQGTTELLGRVAIAASRPPGAAVTDIAPGASAYVRLRLERPAALTRGDRFIVRAYSPSVTIGGGVVLDPHPPRSAIRTEAGVARLRRIDWGSAAGDAVLSFIDETGAAGLPRGALTSRAGLMPSQAAAVAADLIGFGPRQRRRRPAGRAGGDRRPRAPAARGAERPSPRTPALGWHAPRGGARALLRTRGPGGVRARARRACRRAAHRGAGSPGARGSPGVADAGRSRGRRRARSGLPRGGSRATRSWRRRPRPLGSQRTWPTGS